MLIGLGVVAVAIAGIVVFLVTRSDDRPPVVVEYTVEVMSDSYCEEFYLTGYDDIPYAEVVVIAGDGSLLGAGMLDGGYDTDDSCVFASTFEIRRSPDGFYRITAGNSNRGYLNYDEGDLRNNKLFVDATIG